MRPYKCNSCDKSFTQRCSLESHTLKVHGIAHDYAYKERRTKVYVCEECGHTTDQPEKHYLHLKLHHPYSPALAKFNDQEFPFANAALMAPWRTDLWLPHFNSFIIQMNSSFIYSFIHCDHTHTQRLWDTLWNLFLAFADLTVTLSTCFRSTSGRPCVEGVTVSTPHYAQLVISLCSSLSSHDLLRRPAGTSLSIFSKLIWCRSPVSSSQWICSLFHMYRSHSQKKDWFCSSFSNITTAFGHSSSPGSGRRLRGHCHCPSMQTPHVQHRQGSVWSLLTIIDYLSLCFWFL